MKLFILLLSFTFLLFSSPLTLTQEEQTFIKEHPILRVQNERKWAPIDFRENAKPQGYAVEYIQLLAQKAGFKVKFYPGRSWASYLQMLDEKKLDIISSMKITPQRKNYALFSDTPSLELFNAILQRDDSQLFSMEALKGKTVAVVKGHYQENILKRDFPEIKLVYAKNSLEAMKFVATKKADVTIEYYSVLQYHIKKYSFVGLHALALKNDKHFSSTKQYVAMRNDWPLLQSILNKAQKNISEKELHQLRTTWLGELQDKQTQFSPAELAYLKKKGKIRFCSDPNWLPIEKIEEGKHLGISADYLKIISEQNAINFTLIPTTSWSESLAFVKTDKCDFLSSAVRTKGRESYLNFSSSYLDSSLVIITKEGTFFIHSLKSLDNQKIAVVQDYAYDEILRRDHPKINLVYVSNAYEGMKAVDEGKIHAFVTSLEVSSYQLRTHSFSDLQISGELDEKISLSFTVKKDNFILFNILEKSLNSISKKEKKDVYDKWIFVNIEKTDYLFLVKVLLVLGIIIAFFAYRHKMTLNYNNQLLTINKELESLNEQLQELSQTDQLTKISNRRHLDTNLAKELKRAKRFDSSLSLVLVDIDFFKQINDSYGHQKGDDVLKVIAKILRRNSRDTDTVGRWGGEEFLLILSQADIHQATDMADKLRLIISDYNFGLEKKVTASFGVTQFQQSKDDEQSFLSRVDANLYEAKETGRNKIIAS